MPDKIEPAVRNFDAAEGRVLGALRELKDAIAALGGSVEDKPIIAISLQNEAFQKVSEHVREHCVHGSSGQVSTNLDNDELIAIWKGIELTNYNPADYRITYSTVYESDIQSGYEIDPRGRDVWYGRRVLEITHNPQGRYYEIKTAIPRERYRDRAEDQLSRAQRLQQEREAEVRYQASRRTRDNVRVRYIIDEAVENIPYPTPPVPPAPPADPYAQMVNYARALEILNYNMPTVTPTLDEIVIPRATHSNADADRTERLRTRAPVYQAEAARNGRITGVRGA